MTKFVADNARYNIALARTWLAKYAAKGDTKALAQMVALIERWERKLKATGA